jgi:Domain of unknown function (DUF4158)
MRDAPVLYPQVRHVGPSRNPSFARTPGQVSPGETAVPVWFLRDGERQRLERFVAQIVPGDIETYFTLSRADRRQVPRTASPANRLGFALQLGALRYLGRTRGRNSFYAGSGHTLPSTLAVAETVELSRVPFAASH